MSRRPIAADTVRRRARRMRSTPIDLAIREGEFLAIVGPSGCGKSTLLRIIAGLHLPSAGEARVGGRLVDRPQTDIGIVFQSPVLLDWRNVLDNVLVQVELRGLKPRAYRDRALAIACAGRPRRFCRPPSARAVRRHAPAGGDRPRADPRCAAAAVRRAVRRAGCAHPRADASRRRGAVAVDAGKPSCSSPIRSTRPCCSRTAWS